MWFLLSVASAAPADRPLPTTNPPAPEAAPAEVEVVHPATLTFDCKVPAEILVDGVKVGQLWFPGSATWKVAAGPHHVRIYVAGQPTEHPVSTVADASYTFLVGRTGTTMSNTTTAAPAATGPVRVGVRVVGAQAAQVRIDDRRETVVAGQELVLELPTGTHPLSLRSAEGTAIWSTGVLELTGGPVILQVSEGRMPEVSGGAVFHTGS